jgi:uncharacterized protein (DUF608 family)
MYFDGAHILGYSGAALSLFLSIAGAYEVAAKLISETEASYASILRDF